MSRVESKVESKVAGLKMSLKVQWHSNNNFVIFLYLRINNGHNDHMVRVFNEKLCQSSTTLEI